MTDGQIRDLAEDVVAISVSDAATAQAVAARLRSTASWPEAVAGLNSVAVQYDPAKTSPHEVGQALQAALETCQQAPSRVGEIHEIPIQYGGPAGPDLAAVCQQLSIRADTFITRHSSPLYSVEMIGFTPGFAYLGGLDPSLNVPRLATPRRRVGAGSVGISAAYCGLYALAGPGGWPLIGQTDTALFDAARSDPFRIHPGDQIRFIPQ